MRTIPPEQITKFLNGFDRELKGAMEKILGNKLNNEQWLVCQLPAKYGGLGLRSGKLVAGAQHVMSMQKCAEQMANHSKGWSLERRAKETSEAWLKDRIGPEFDMDTWLSEGTCTSRDETPISSRKYPLSLAQECEYSCYKRSLKSMSDSDH